MAEYSVNPQVEQDSITAYLREQFPEIPFIEDGIPAGDYKEITFDSRGRINTFAILWYSDIKKGAKKSFAGHKLDSYSATVDVAVIAHDGTRARKVLNVINDRLVGFRVSEGGHLSKGTPLFGDSRQIRQEATRPERWMRTARFDFGIASKRVA